MADVIAVISKAVFEPEMKAHRLAPGVLWATKAYVSQNKALAPLAGGGRLFLVTVRPPDEALWLVAVLEQPKSDGKQWAAATNSIPVRDVSAIKRSLKFANGQGLPDKVGVLGMSLQTPRVLAAGDIALLLGDAAPVAKVAEPAPAPRSEPPPAPKPKKAKKPASEPPPAPAPASKSKPPGPPAASFEEVVAAWRRTRHPRYRMIAEALSAKEPARPALGGSNKKADVQEWFDVERANDWRDMPRLLASMTKCNSQIATERVTLITRRDDPRLISSLLTATEVPPYTASSTRHFWQAAIRALGASNDTAARDKMIEIGKRYKLISDTAQGQTIARDLHKAAAEMKGGGPLSEADKKAALALEKKLGITPPSETTAPKTESAMNAESLFEAIVAAPDDDDARLIYADVLSEKNDDRGEFILLQVERAKGHGSAERSDLEREKFHKTKRIKEFSLPLSAAADQVMFERGFPVEVRLQANGLGTIIDAPEWGTVRKISLLNAPSAKNVIELLTKGNVSNVVDVGTVTIHMLGKLKNASFPWRKLRVQAEGLTAEHLSRFPNLTRLELGAGRDYQPTPFDPKLLGVVRNITELAFGDQSFASAAIPFSECPMLKRLELGRSSTNVTLELGAHAFRNEQIEELALWGSVQSTAPWLEAMPKVKKLFMFTNNNAADAIALLNRFPQLEIVETGRYLNARRTRFERAPEGDIRLVLVPNQQLYAQINDEAAANATELRPLGITKLVIHPIKPRHQLAPVDPAVIERIRDTWGPNNVTVTDLL